VIKFKASNFSLLVKKIVSRYGLNQKKRRLFFNHLIFLSTPVT